MRKVLEAFGRKGKRAYVRVVRETVGRHELVRVIWNEPGKGRTLESFDDTRKGIAEAKAFALGKHESLLDHAPAGATQGFSPLTLRQLRDQYFAAFVNEWEPTTLANKTAAWKNLELGLRRETDVGSITPKQLDEFVTWLLATPVLRVHKKRSANQVRMTVATLTAAVRWAVEDGRIGPTRVMTYNPKLKQALKKQIVETAEYSADERARLTTALDPRHPTEWRAWALTMLFAYCAPRQRAARHLEIADITLAEPSWTDGQPSFSGSILWRAETDKMDNERSQPMPSPVAEAFWVAFGWRAHDEYAGRFVFYGVQRRTRGQALRRDPHRAKAKESIEGISVGEKPYTYGALNAALRRAEDRCGIEHIPYRATHGHRRGVSGDIHQQTGSSKKAADWIGDRSTKVVEKHYLLTRSEALQESADLVTSTVADAAKSAKPITLPNTKRHKTQRPRSESEAEGTKPVNQTSTIEPAVGIEPTTAQCQKDGKRPSSSNSSEVDKVATILTEETLNWPHRSATECHSGQRSDGEK